MDGAAVQLLQQGIEKFSSEELRYVIKANEKYFMLKDVIRTLGITNQDSYIVWSNLYKGMLPLPYDTSQNMVISSSNHFEYFIPVDTIKETCDMIGTARAIELKSWLSANNVNNILKLLENIQAEIDEIREYVSKM